MECNVPTDIVFSFSGLRQRGGRTAPHADGWGLAFYEGRAARVFLEPAPACVSPLARFLAENPIKTLLAVGHIRKRTQGPTTLANTHPFVRELWGRYWVFAHNGDLKDFRPRLHRHGTFNMLLSNGQALWAHCSTHLHYVVREHPFGAPVLADKDLMVDFAAHTGPADRVAIVATEPLTRNEAWQAMTPGQLMTFTCGQVATRQCPELAKQA